MENSSIKEIWKKNEVLLDESRKLNVSILKDVKLDKAKSALNNLLFLPISTMAFFILVAAYALLFMVNNLETWYFWFSGAVVTFFALLYIFSSFRQLKLILSINYNSPIVTLQKKLAKIKTSVVFNLKIAAWLIPFGPFVGLFFIKALFNLDLVSMISYDIIIAFGVITILLEILSLVLLRALRPKNINKKWLNWLIAGSGSQVDEALNFLNQIKTFENEEK